jgi:D-3-phosphoglycerate dehydrogenase / 2-oxoglutarate reductase
VSEMRSTVSEDYVSLISLGADTDEGPVSVGGTLVGKRNAERVMQVFDFEIELAPAEHMIFFIYADRPGVIGTVGTILGGHGVNIATMEVGRTDEGGEALMCLTVDAPVPPDVLQNIASEIGASRLRAITLPA